MAPKKRQRATSDDSDSPPIKKTRSGRISTLPAKYSDDYLPKQSKRQQSDQSKGSTSSGPKKSPPEQVRKPHSVRPNKSSRVQSKEPSPAQSKGVRFDAPPPNQPKKPSQALSKKTPPQQPKKPVQKTGRPPGTRSRAALALSEESDSGSDTTIPARLPSVPPEVRRSPSSEADRAQFMRLLRERSKKRAGNKGKGKAAVAPRPVLRRQPAPPRPAAPPASPPAPAPVAIAVTATRSSSTLSDLPRTRPRPPPARRPRQGTMRHLVSAGELAQIRQINPFAGRGPRVG
ncbi:MAG: hypothetical protein M1820_003481 [Bogoriella megaspora]|nr:MAG: hypothetical protein M1820_003481 [Bogoriella megaspora]